MWLDNTILGAESTCITYQANGLVTGTECIESSSIPNRASFDPDTLLKEGSAVLKRIKFEVLECGQTYWLYKRKNL
jgi:hypothetical protein